MNISDFLAAQIDTSDPVIFCLSAFIVMFISIDFVHVFFTGVFSWFKK